MPLANTRRSARFGAEARRRLPDPVLFCAPASFLRLALRRGGLAPQGGNRPQVMQRMAGHDFPPAMPVQLPAKGAVAHPATFHGRDNAGHPEGEARLGIWAAERAQPVGPVQKLLGRPGLHRRQAMLGTEVPDGIMLVALHCLRLLWLAKGG